MEIEWAFLRHNTSVFFASPSLIVQGTFLNPDELGHSVSALRTERNPEIAATEGEGGSDGAADDTFEATLGEYDPDAQIHAVWLLWRAAAAVNEPQKVVEAYSKLGFDLDAFGKAP